MIEHNIRKLGTLYINGIPSFPSVAYTPRDTITFGDTVSGKELLWLPIPGSNSWVLQTVLLSGISWRQLRDQQFVDGAPFIMDEDICMVRLPKIGKGPQDQSELESAAILDEESRYWGYETFISFENKKKPEQQCAVGTGHNWSSLSPAECQADLGFRPVIDFGIRRF